MKRYLASLAIGATLIGAPMAEAQEKITWRMSSYAAETWGIYQYFVLPFVERVNAAAEGRLEIVPYPVDVLAPALRKYEAVLDGTADAAMVTPLYAVNAHPASSFYGGHPGGMGAETMLYWFYMGDGQELLTQMRRDTMGLHSLVGGLSATELWHGHQPIETVEDLAGVRFRAAGAWAEVLSEYFDAAPVFLTGGEIYTMLERRGVDLVEWSTPHENKVIGLASAAPYIMMPGMNHPAGINEFIVRADVWDALPEDLQQIVTDAAKLAVFDSFLISGMWDIEAMDVLRESRAEIRVIPDEVIAAVTEAGRSWSEAQSEKMSAEGDEWMAKITESYYAFQERWARNSIYRHYDLDR